MNIQSIRNLITQHSPRSKLILGVAAALSVAIVGSAGIAAARGFDDSPGTNQIAAYCKTHYKTLHYKNVGQCIGALARDRDDFGYGGTFTPDGDEVAPAHHHHP